MAWENWLDLILVAATCLFIAVASMDRWLP